MKKIIFLGTIGALFVLGSCNNFFKSNEPVVMKFTTHKEALDTLRKKFLVDNRMVDSIVYEDSSIQRRAHISYSALSIDAEKELLTQLDFSKLLGSKDEENDYASIYNGFFGADKYRIEFYIANAKTDTANPGTIALSGKTRFQKNIQPFSGNIVIDSVFEFRDSVVMKYWKEYTNGEIKSYYLCGHFELSEEQSKWGTGTYKGKFHMDVQINSEDGGQSYWYYSNGSEAEYIGEDDSAGKAIDYGSESRSGTRGAGFLFEGTWTSYKTNSSKPLLLAHDIFMFGNEILENFSYGEREIEINPKYKTLGWDNYWENEEWYSDKGDKVMMISW